MFAGEPAEIRGPDVDVAALVYDSRQVVDGSLFAALPGFTSDGHDHVPAAVAAGAAAVLCERPVEAGGATVIEVPRSRLALARAARCFYGDPAEQMRTVGITGTNGKTTVAHLLEAVLAAAGERPGIIGTLGTRYAGAAQGAGLTTPESVDLVALLAAMHAARTTAVAMEVSSHALAQERASGVDFDVGVFTNLTQDHLDYHGSLGEYFAAKSRLFLERLKPGGRAVLNLDDARVGSLASRLRDGSVFGFSLAACTAPWCRVELLRLQLDRDGMRASLRVGDGEVLVRSPMLGRFNVENILATVAVAEALDIDRDATVAGIAALAGVPGRLERIDAQEAPLVLVDYAHTPDALAKVLQAVREVTEGRVICLFGCGGDRDQDKRSKMGEVVGKLADYAVLTSDNPRGEDPMAIIAEAEPGLVRAGAERSTTCRPGGYLVEADRARAIREAVRGARALDAVLIAGKGHEAHQIVGADKHPFDDRSHARHALAEAGYTVVLAGPQSEG
jgi:UDP-N-acetylmuramoyl-L-alanyl-D-glutamate--2,6-diaminopimelate ligase